MTAGAGGRVPGGMEEAVDGVVIGIIPVGITDLVAVIRAVIRAVTGLVAVIGLALMGRSLLVVRAAVVGRSLLVVVLAAVVAAVLVAVAVVQVVATIRPQGLDRRG